MPTEVILDAFSTIKLYIRSQLLEIPGMPIVLAYIQRSYQNDPFRVVLEAFLIFFTLRYLSSKPKPSKIELTERVHTEIDELVADWEPEPLVNAHEPIEASKPLLVSEAGAIVKDETGKEMINMLSSNYLGLYNTQITKDVAIETVKSYGVGTCGPAGFYGTIDVHLKLEKELARVLNTESAIIYAQGYAALSSVIPAFSKRGDIIVADEQVNVSIIKGMQISRSRLYYYKHNDMDDLVRVLESINEEEKRTKRALTRRFIVVEGLFSKTGEIVKLRNLIPIKNRFKYRLIVDESNSLGALGPRGLGVGDHFGIPNSDIEIIVGFMSTVLGSAGGFCAGSEAVIDHQRLSSQAYCFSASLPSLLARCALKGLLEIEAQPEKAQKLAHNVSKFRSLLTKSIEENCKSFELLGDLRSPLMFIRLRNSLNNVKFERTMLQEIVNQARSNGVLVSLPACIEKEEKTLPRPSIKIVVTAAHEESQLQQTVKALTKCMTECKIRNF